MNFVKAIWKPLSEFVQVGLTLFGIATALGIIGLLAKLISIPLRFGWSLLG
jgi:hypothetical protein